MIGSNGSAQLALDFTRKAGSGPEVQPFQVEKMIALLRGKGWLTARDLGAETESAKRILRALAKASNGEILGGAKGYLLTREASGEDIKQAKRLKSQAREELRRYFATMRVWHQSPYSERVAA